MKKISITEKLVLISLSVSFAIIFLVAAFSFYKAKNIVIDRTFNQLTSVRMIKTALLRQFFENSITEIKSAKNSCKIKDLLSQINEQNTSDFKKKLKSDIIKPDTSLLNDFEIKKYAAILLSGNNNNFYYLKKRQNFKVLKDIDIEDINNYLKSYKDIYIQDYSQSKCTFSLLTLSTKIYDAKGHSGNIIFEISPDALDNFMLENSPENGLGKSGESYLVGSDFLMRSTSRFKKNSLMRTVVKTEAVKDAFKNNSGNKIIKDYRGIKVLSSYGKINFRNLNWLILAEIDYKEAMIPIYNIRNEIIFYSIFIFLIVLIIVIILSRNITIPIQKLNKAIYETGEGNFDEFKIKKTNDEIGELSESFVKMYHKISEQNKTIEKERINSLNLLIDGQEKERSRLSREIHDSLGQLLIALKLKYDRKKELNFIKEKEDDLNELFDKTIEETRRISNNLMPATLIEFGLFTAVRNLCNEISELSQIYIVHNFSGNEKLLSEKCKVWTFRIIQEGLTNILKHSEAKNANIELKISGKKLQLTVIDDGKGFDYEKAISGNSKGLKNIKDRVMLLGGTVKIISEKLKGSQISIRIPVNKKNEE